MERDEALDLLHDALIGEGAKPVKGRENRKEPCQCCKIDPKLMRKNDGPKNHICTTKGAIGSLNDKEELEWCSNDPEGRTGGQRYGVKLVENGRCERTLAIRKAAAICREQFLSDPDEKDVVGFFNCFIPEFTRPLETEK